MSADALRSEFVRLLTVDSETRDRRRKEFNQAIFDAGCGRAVFNGTDLAMVMEKFDRAVANMEAKALLAKVAPWRKCPQCGFINIQEPRTLCRDCERK